jgi:hypothetical protein
LVRTQGERIPAEAVLDRVAERCAANDFDGRAVAEPHLEETTADVRVTADGNDAPATADAEVVQTTSVDRTGMVARRKVAGLLHIADTPITHTTELRFRFNRSIRR